MLIVSCGIDEEDSRESDICLCNSSSHIQFTIWLQESCCCTKDRLPIPYVQPMGREGSKRLKLKFHSISKASWLPSLPRAGLCLSFIGFQYLNWNSNQRRDTDMRMTDRWKEMRTVNALSFLFFLVHGSISLSHVCFLMSSLAWKFNRKWIFTKREGSLVPRKTLKFQYLLNFNLFLPVKPCVSLWLNLNERNSNSNTRDTLSSRYWLTHTLWRISFSFFTERVTESVSWWECPLSMRHRREKSISQIEFPQPCPCQGTRAHMENSFGKWIFYIELRKPVSVTW